MRVCVCVCVCVHSWPEWLAIWALHHYNSTSTGTTTGRVRVLNGGVPGITSQYMSLCVNIHAPKVHNAINAMCKLLYFMKRMHACVRVCGFTCACECVCVQDIDIAVVDFSGAWHD